MPLAPDRIVTARLVGERITADDRAFYRAIWQEPAVVRTLGGPRPRDVIDARVERQVAAWALHGFGMYTLREAGGREPCGYAGLAPTQTGGRSSVEVLYGFLPAVWRRGLASEAAQALVALGRGPLALPEVCGFTWIENVGSQRVLESAGLVHAFDFEHVGLPHRYYRTPAIDT